MNFKQLVFEGNYDGRPVTLFVIDNGENFIVETTQQSDFADPANFFAGSKGGPLTVPADTIEKLYEALLEFEFSQRHAQDIVRNVSVYRKPTQFSFEFSGLTYYAAGVFGTKPFEVTLSPPLSNAADSTQEPISLPIEHSITAHSREYLAAELGWRYPGFRNLSEH